MLSHNSSLLDSYIRFLDVEEGIDTVICRSKRAAAKYYGGDVQRDTVPLGHRLALGGDGALIQHRHFRYQRFYDCRLRAVSSRLSRQTLASLLSLRDLVFLSSVRSVECDLTATISIILRTRSLVFYSSRLPAVSVSNASPKLSVPYGLASHRLDTGEKFLQIRTFGGPQPRRHGLRALCLESLAFGLSTSHTSSTCSTASLVGRRGTPVKTYTESLTRQAHL